MRTFIAALLGLLICLCGGAAQPRENDGKELYFFNPDSSQTNLGRLKHEVDAFFVRVQSPMSFQPFAHQMDFDRKLTEQRPAFLFIPQWYLERYGKEHLLRPFLIPIRRGETNYRKVLLAKKNEDTGPETAGNRSLAMTSMGPDEGAGLHTFLTAHLRRSIGQLRTVIVPKDSDALFALVLGQVDLALVVKENMEQILEINPKVLQSIQTIAESPGIPMPVLCYSEGKATPNEVNALKELLLNIRKTEEGSKLMEMLQFDGWQTYSQ